MDNQTTLPFTGKKIKNGKMHLKQYAKITLGCISVIAMLGCIVAVAGEFKAPDHPELAKLTEERLKIESDLKDTLVHVKENQVALENATAKADDLRTKRTTVETSINSLINPDAVK